MNGYHSASSAVHHTNTSCPSGAAIPAEEVLKGSGGLPLCEWCRRASELEHWLSPTING
jgi:hypothetical protein